MGNLHTHQKRFYVDQLVYFVTIKTLNNFPYFKYNFLADLFIAELTLCQEIKNFELYAFNVLYDHVHILLKPSKESNISVIIKSLKENFSRDANRIILKKPIEAAASTSRLHIDKNINEVIKQKQLFMPKFAWQKSFHDHYIRNSKDLKTRYNYTVFNHLKHSEDRAYTSDYKFTSLNYFEIIDEAYF